ncbi:(Fe-S)-binding protein [Anaerobacillus isosaccharinicus]|uniref:Glycolate oxidase iron-sulfur subunit n=1 Tax=Anaerobacillus isosaccharinicus TaxID=1532552 RepID=A0A1S2LRA3_9BACI|nr:(Fe-S)-binding protein [Anaerobacillus isosaccharinicus]MBA5585451.1 (Fe-S)-binding protein [Anaerobacillus isosaccharinicus]QOY36231.1 (Fe-S)-binding protein [Anaerobacillus isosaccharinicus]
MSAANDKRQQELAIDMKQGMDYDELINCMRCGFCLPACPTYRESGGNEAASPRGRIALMKAVVDGIMEPDEDFEKQLSQCLGCRACEPACPSGMKYGFLLEDARDIIQKKKKHSLPVKMLRNVVFNELFPKPNRMRMVSSLLWFYQSTGIQKIAQATHLTKIAPGNLSAMERVLPKVPSPSKMKNRPSHVASEGVAKKKVAFFSGCLMDTMFMDTNDSTLYILSKSNCEIVIPKKQNCCGALHAHSGEKDGAKQLAKENILAFEKVEAEYIISNAGGCGALLVDYGHLLKDDPEWADRAKAFSAKVKDISEVLYEVGMPKMRLEPQTVTYQDSCHLRNVMGTFSAPRKLLQSIEGVTFTEMKDADRCCGSAGVYNIIEQEMSMQILDVKMKDAKATKARTLVTANPGCLLQMKLGIERAGLQKDVRGIHIVDLLAEAVRYAEGQA